MVYVLLPIICWTFTTLTFYKKVHCWRSSFLLSSVVWGCVLTVITESLSYFRILDLWWLEAAWGTADVIATVMYVRTTPRRMERTDGDPASSSIITLSLTGIVVIVLLTGLVALVAPPNNYDSMTYHMGRVVHWMQNRSIAHYPTNIIRQIESAPWAEWSIMHFQILGGTDRFANLIQWFSVVGFLLGTSLIAKLIGADNRGQILSAVFAATIPMGILQASSTQNDAVVAFWLVCFVYFGILMTKNALWVNAAAAGASLGLALVTKGTAYIFAFPFLTWFLIAGYRQRDRKIVVNIITVGLVALMLNAGFYMRNYAVFANPLRSGEIPVANNIYSVPVLISNVLRNLALHSGTLSAHVNRGMTTMIGYAHRLIRMDVNDPRTTWGGSSFSVNPPSLHEDTAGNPLHMLLIILCGISIIVSSKYRRDGRIKAYMVTLLMAAILFSALLRWQPWASRLQLPLFVLGAPLVGIVLGNAGRTYLVRISIIVLLISSVPYLMYNESRPLIRNRYHSSILKASRIDQYFYNRPSIQNSYRTAAETVRKSNCSNIGLVTGCDDWEYPFWVLLKAGNGPLPRIEHIRVKNASTGIPLSDFVPCLVLKNDEKGDLYSIREKGLASARHSRM